MNKLYPVVGSCISLIVFSSVSYSQCNHPLTITILFDNYPFAEGLETDWGFSCLIEGLEKTILFDTGNNGAILDRNAQALGVDYSKIDIITLSHNHTDHTNGLTTMLRKKSDVTVYAPESCSGLQRTCDRFDTQFVSFVEPVEFCACARSTGEMGTAILEQSIILYTQGGQIIITGCAHPGIVSIVEKAKELSDAPILLAAGGFHLLSESQSSIRSIINRLKELGVQNAAPSHCTGDLAIQMFREEYQDHFVELGVGRIVRSASFVTTSGVNDCYMGER